MTEKTLTIIRSLGWLENHVDENDGCCHIELEPGEMAQAEYILQMEQYRRSAREAVDSLLKHLKLSKKELPENIKETLDNAIEMIADNFYTGCDEEDNPNDKNMWYAMARDALEDVLRSHIYGTGKRNTLVSYLYRDASNYKVHNEAVLIGPYTDAQIKDILEHTVDGENFIPEMVGLDAERFSEYDLHEDTPFLEIYDTGFELTDKEPTTDLTMEQLVQNFRKASENKWGGYVL